jgi:hypothetical protein
MSVPHSVTPAPSHVSTPAALHFVATYFTCIQEYWDASAEVPSSRNMIGPWYLWQLSTFRSKACDEFDYGDLTGDIGK